MNHQYHTQFLSIHVLLDISLMLSSVVRALNRFCYVDQASSVSCIDTQLRKQLLSLTPIYVPGSYQVPYQPVFQSKE